MLTSNVPFNWALVSVSLFNTILLTWLGLMVLLNSDRRAWGIWLGGGGLLLGAAFFLSHTMILSLGLYSSGWSVIFWWSAGMAPAIILPAAWYVAMLWYAGYWARPHSDLRRRQHLWLRLVLLFLALGILALALSIYLLATPESLLTQLRLYFRWSIAGIPLLALTYSIYIILCTVLSLDALRRPGPSARMMGQLARQRAHPWLAVTSLTLLLVGLLVSGAMAWLAGVTHQASFADLYDRLVETIAWLDLIIAALISISVLLLGQAVVSYELFTGKTLPRRGLVRHWYGMVVLAAGYSLLVSGSQALGLRPFYTIVMASLLMTLALVLLSWRSFVERDRTVTLLRPFLTSQHLYDRLLTPIEKTGIDIAAPFTALCGEVLGAERAYLAPLGPLTPLVGAPLVYPDGADASLPPLGDLASRFESPETMAAPLDPNQYDGASWAVPLWSQRGLSGVLLLGNKEDGGLYAQEEIEIARISCERLLDTRASAELGRRLMTLQRERLVQNQMMDLRARRVLHDEVLPDLQAALIEVASSQDGGQAAALLNDSHRLISDLLSEIPTATAAEVARLGFIPVLRRTVEYEFAGAFDEVHWQIEAPAEEQAARLSGVMGEALFYATREAIRNAARHGRDENREEPYRLLIILDGQETLNVTVQDNGKGLLERNGGEETSGRGLALYSAMMAVVGGSLTVDSSPGRYTCVHLSLRQPAAVDSSISQ